MIVMNSNKIIIKNNYNENDDKNSTHNEDNKE